MNKHTQTVLTILMFAIVFATGTLLISVWFLPPAELTPSIALLNESLEAGPYPTNITQYENINLNVQVSNFLGVVQYFYVRAKLADGTTLANRTQPSPVPILEQYERILQHGRTWTFPVQLNMTTIGINFRLTFELWRYNPTNDEIIYTGIWVHLPLNVTS